MDYHTILNNGISVVKFHRVKFASRSFCRQPHCRGIWPAEFQFGKILLKAPSAFRGHSVLKYSTTGHGSIETKECNVIDKQATV